MTLPNGREINPSNEPVLHWGVRFATEGTPPAVMNYGPGPDAKARAEAIVEEWKTVDEGVTLVCQTVLPWTSSATTHRRVLLTQAIREAASDPRGILILRHWLVENGYDEEKQYKTGLREQVPLIKQMRREANIERALNAFNIWMRDNNYESLTSDEAIEMLREKLDK